ncbi:hypothetical protein ANCCAN_10412 [Ancylostoma caninum]|uniref:Uncharacterized protein n=1 Tax=Ancylostoma caninum TaxID=29170 RepID=A0A368GGY1_ANCCA|nr:hypothetical protein ANCCAN_10412 [Ancylostoma caninum]
MILLLLLAVAALTQGNPERDCNIFSTKLRSCSQNETKPHFRKSGPSSIKIYDKDGTIVLQWNNQSTDAETQEESAHVSHIVPKSKWDRQRIFWRRRRRNAPRGPVITCHCMLNASYLYNLFTETS